LSINRLRLQSRTWASDFFTLDVAYDLLPVVGAFPGGSTVALGESTALHLWDLKTRLHTGEGWVLGQNLDQVQLSFEFDETPDRRS
jgi:hypothetical protein